MKTIALIILFAYAMVICWERDTTRHRAAIARPGEAYTHTFTTGADGCPVPRR